MLTEQCAICDATVSFADTVHVLLNTKSDAGVVDYYVCTDCYDDDLAPLFPDPDATDSDDEFDADDAEADDADAHDPRADDADAHDPETDDADAHDPEADDGGAGSGEGRSADGTATDGAGSQTGPARE